jgi:transposase
MVCKGPPSLAGRPNPLNFPCKDDTTMKFVAPLSDPEIQTLTDMHRFHPSRRARMRAHGLLLSHQGFSLRRIADVYQVSRYAVAEWIERWQSAGLVGLYDHPRAGRPLRLTADEQHKVEQYLQDHPKDLKHVVHVLEQETNKRVSTKTIKRLIKKNRYVWKRLRKTPAKSPDPAKYQRAQARIAALQARARAGECALWYFDASGFCLEPCIPYAWQPIGQTLKLPQSSHNQRLNVLGFLQRDNTLVPYLIDGPIDTAAVVACMDQFSAQLDKKAYVLIDNAPMHRSKAFVRHIPKWVKKGLIIKYLPPYSPELNVIEILWRFMKYYWLPFSAYVSFQHLCEAVEEILQQFGTKYTIDFQAA